jgi:AraC-like DNA-binding protein
MPEATVSAGFCEGKADHRPAKCRNANRQGRTLRSWLSNIRGPDACLYRRHGRAVRRTFRLTGPFAIREAQAAGTVSTSISGSVADTCRGGIDTFSFPDCRHSLGGAASIRLISPAASVYAVSRDVEVQDALVFARRNLHEPLSVDLLAEAARLSPRQFSRVFRAETGQSPAKAIENLRLEAAGLMLQQGRLPIEAIAKETGFGDRERMRRAFLRAYGQAPQAIRNASHPLAAI